MITRKEEASEATTNIAEEVNLKPQPAQEKSEIAGIVEKSPGFYIQEKEPKSEDHKIKIRPDKEVELANNELTASKADLKNNPEKLELSKKETVEVEPGSIYLRNQIQVGWYSQIAAPQSLQDANGLAGKLHSSGFPVAIERAQVRGQVYYRVLVGPEEDRVKGERLLGQVKRESYLVGQPFLRLIK